MRKHKIVFIGGLHRSGTSLVFRCLRDHPKISGFRDTGVSEDEGQWLQSVYPPARVHGGPGRFGFDLSYRYDERSKLVSASNARKLFEEWSRYWDLKKPFLLEKSPPNLIHSRFLQALFPSAIFLMILRHPVAVSYATQRTGTRLAVHKLIEHWLTCHEQLASDRAHLRRCLVVHYENFVESPRAVLDQVCDFLGLARMPLTQQVRRASTTNTSRNGTHCEKRPWENPTRISSRCGSKGDSTDSVTACATCVTCSRIRPCSSPPSRWRPGICRGAGLSACHRSPKGQTPTLMHVVYTGAHGGFDTARIPLGGGAAVMDALVREWSRTGPFALTVLGVGSGYDLPDVKYVQLSVAVPMALTDMSELEYARFCREFERAATEWIQNELIARRRWPSTLILSNDISEGPNFRELAALDLPIATIFHVDVVEYVAKFYCRNWFCPATLTRLHRWLASLRADRLLPDVVRLIFEKQEDCVRHSQKLIVPSHGMGDVLRRCYRGCENKIEVLPWGAIKEMPNTECRMPNVKDEFGVGDDDVVLLTLCRISPEKGIDRLLEALWLMEAEQGFSTPATPGRVRVFICGAAAYMGGEAYLGKLRKLASRLRTARVHFVGHVSGERKRAFFELANLYVHLSYHESYGLTIAEAMTHGCPVLTTNHHSARDLVPADCGRIVSGNSDETVAALRDLLADRERLRAMGRAAAEHAKKLDFSRAAARLAAVLTELASTHALRGN